MPRVETVHSQQIIKYINIAREYPKYYLPLLEQQINSFENDFQYKINTSTICETNQGYHAWIVARKFLESQKPISPLIQLSGLTKAAGSHACDLEQINQITHEGSNGSTFIDRIMKFCKKTEGALVEIIGNDFDITERNHAEMIILGLIIDDGITSRGHRNSIFNQQYKYIGCGVGYLQGKIVAVINMSQSKLRQRSIPGETSSSNVELSESNISNEPHESQLSENNIAESKLFDIKNKKSFYLGKQLQKSHKPKQTWIFNEVIKLQKQYDISIDHNKENSQIEPINQSKKHQSTAKTHSNSQIERQNGSQYQLSNAKMKSMKDSFSNEKSKHVFYAQDISNDRNLEQSSKSFSNQTMMKKGMKKIKEKKQKSRIWQQGEFKFEQTTTFIKYTDGTEEEFKQKNSLLLDESINK